VSVLAVVPARGGSKGLPGKNLLPLGGVPLVARAIEAARNSRAVDRVVVSTDDPRIAEVARRAGAEVVERPEDLAGDTASSESVLLHALEMLEDTEGYRPELLVFLQCTAPLLTAREIDDTVDALRREEADSAFAAVPFHHFLWRRGGDPAMGAVGVNHDPAGRQRRQDREPEYLEAGSVYVMRADGFRDARHRFFGRVALHPLPPQPWVEVDEPADLEVAAALLAARRDDDLLELLPARPAALVLDFDGVLTDNRVLVLGDGTEGVWCDRGDGYGLDLLLSSTGLPVTVLSRERNPVVAARCRKLGIDCRQDLQDKTEALESWLREQGADPADALYVGNDLNDLDCMARVGCPVAVADAAPEVRRAARIVLDRPGGRGAVRQLTDLLRRKLRSTP
jgi:YrbI family 3-deoxy-D-manno-octulosonate 8-phosphate phosphatase